MSMAVHSGPTSHNSRYVPYLLALLVGLVIVAYVLEFTLVLPRWILGYGVK